MKNVLIACEECSPELLEIFSGIGVAYIAGNLKDALSMLEMFDFSFVIIDYKMPSMIGLRLLDEMKKKEIKTPVFGFAHSLYWKDRFVSSGAKDCFSILDDPKKIEEKIRNIIC